MRQVVEGVSCGLRCAVAAIALLLLSATPGWAAEHQVALQGNEFVPRNLTIAAGDTVVWTDRDVAPHSVTADDGSFDSHPSCTGPPSCMKANDVFRHTFSNPGTYPYYCRIHASKGSNGTAGMSGVVTVTAPAAGATTTTQAATTTTRRATTTTKRPTAVAPMPSGRATTTRPPMTLLAQPGAPDITMGASVTDPMVTTSTSISTPSAGQAAVVINEEAGGRRRRNLPLLLVATAALASVAAGAVIVSRRAPSPR